MPNVKKQTIQNLPVHSRHFTSSDITDFKLGKHYTLFEKLGAHPMKFYGRDGVYFSVWAPNAKRVSVIGSFNNWNKKAHILNKRDDNSGIWEGFIDTASSGDLYKYHIVSKNKGWKADKIDPFAFSSEIPPQSASRICDLDYSWEDQKWMNKRKQKSFDSHPISIYEVHLGSWKRRLEDGGFLSYEQMADELVKYVKDMGFTHVEFLPITEHPFYGSWGYQSLGFFSATSRYGTPQQLMYLIDRFHQEDIGVILDWVPSHFPADEHGLSMYDGTALFGFEDPDLRFHPDWKSCIFNNGRKEVVEFLISSLIFWLKYYHVDAIRMDAVASMLYLNYSKSDGQWVPNFFGGSENLESIAFIRNLNRAVQMYFPDVLMIAEESTAWKSVSRPASSGGLNFDMKWNMGWMHDTLRYFSRDYASRADNPNDLTFSLLYAFNENFILPFSHDEVVHLKKSLLGKMYGKSKEQFFNLRSLYGFMYAHPGKKLLFMGSELAQGTEWDHESALPWKLLNKKMHRGMQDWLRDLNNLYKKEKALYELDFHPSGFSWLDLGEQKNAVFSFVRYSVNQREAVVFIGNFSNKWRRKYDISVPKTGKWSKLIDSDDLEYGGLGRISQNVFIAQSKSLPKISIDIPPLTVIFLKYE